MLSCAEEPYRMFMLPNTGLIGIQPSPTVLRLQKKTGIRNMFSFPVDSGLLGNSFKPLQEDRCLLVGLSSMTEEEVAKFGPLPDAHQRRHNVFFGRSSCFRLEALPPTAGGTHAQLVTTKCF